MGFKRAVDQGFYSVADLARALNWTQTTVYDWICDGRIPAPKHKYGKKKFYTLTEIEAIRAGCIVKYVPAAKGDRG